MLHQDILYNLTRTGLEFSGLAEKRQALFWIFMALLRLLNSITKYFYLSQIVTATCIFRQKTLSLLMIVTNKNIRVTFKWLLYNEFGFCRIS